MVDINKVNQLNTQYNNRTVKIQDNQGKTHEVKLSVFQEGMAVTSDTKDVAAYFNFNHNNKLDADEVAVLKKVIADYAGSDNKLDDNEILQIFGLNSESPHAEKMLKQFKNMIERQATGSLTVNTTLKDGTKRTESINADGSGMIVDESRTSKTTYTYAKGKVLIKKEVSDEKSNKVSEFTNNKNGQIISEKSVITDKQGAIISTSETKYAYENGRIISSETETKNSKGETTTKTEKYTYNEQGQKIKIEGKTVEPTNITISGNKLERTKTYTIEQEFHPNGNISKRIRTDGDTKIAGKVSTALFNEDGKITHQETKEQKLRVSKDASGKMSISRQNTTQTVDYEYHPNGQKSQTTVKSTDSMGHPSERITRFDQDGKNITSMEKSYYDRGAKVEEKYDGVNIGNRRGLPSEKIEYEKDGTTVKQKTINHFDNDGILVSRDVYDKDGNKVKSYDFSEVDGVFEVSNQVSRGDCYLLAGINSLALTEDGQKLLQQNISVKTNDKGEKLYTVSLPGAAKAKENLKRNGIAEDKIFIQDSYTVTEEELKEAAKKAGIKYSAGDKDVLLLEVAYEKYRTNVVQTVKLDPNNPKIKNVFGMGINLNSKHAKEGDYLSGGLAHEAIYVLTGNAPAVYMNPRANECPVCYVDDDLQLHLTDPNGNIVDKVYVDNDGPTNANLENILDKLENDCEKDGKIDNFAAAAGFKVPTQEVNGQVIKGAGHAFAITKVDKDYVYLSNPWSPDTEIKMSRADFAKAATKVSITPINEEGKKDIKKVVDKPIEGTADENAPKREPSYIVPKGKTYTAIIKEALMKQGISATPENIQKAKEQFEKENPKAVHKTRKRSSRGQQRVISYLYANDKVYIPQFKMN